MEDTHGVMVCCVNVIISISLNPYYNGRYSWRSLAMFVANHGVLILIIMEDTHGEQQ